jgi:hypothetical protein
MFDPHSGLELARARGCELTEDYRRASHAQRPHGNHLRRIYQRQMDTIEALNPVHLGPAAPPG